MSREYVVVKEIRFCLNLIFFTSEDSIYVDKVERTKSEDASFLHLYMLFFCNIISRSVVLFSIFLHTNEKKYSMTIESNDVFILSKEQKASHVERTMLILFFKEIEHVSNRATVFFPKSETKTINKD